MLCSRAVTESETAVIIAYYLQVEGSGLIAIHENAQTLGSLLSFEPVDILYYNIWYIATHLFDAEVYRQGNIESAIY